MRWGQLLRGVLVVILIVAAVLTVGGGRVGAPELAIITLLVAVAITVVIRPARTSAPDLRRQAS